MDTPLLLPLRILEFISRNYLVAVATACSIAAFVVTFRSRRFEDDPFISPVTPEEAAQANQRAERLLISHLDNYQLRCWLERNYFCVTGSDGQQYFITHGYAYNVIVPGDGSYCAYPRGRLPLCDRILAQKMLIETDAGKFRRIANKSRLHAITITL